MLTYTVGLCPEEIRDNSLEYDYNRSAITSENKEDKDITVTVYLCPDGSQCYQGVHLTHKICPIGATCGCNYKVDINWIAYDQDRILLRWTNPDRCILDKIVLAAKSVWEDDWIDLRKYIHERTGSGPVVLLYPDGDERNQGYCHGCGIGGEEGHYIGQERLWDHGEVIPGMIYRVSGFFRDVSCGGRETEVVLGYSKYETPGMTSGRVIAKVNEHPPVFRVAILDINDQDILVEEYWDLYGSDYYNFVEGDKVMIVKPNTVYPAHDPTKNTNDDTGAAATQRFSTYPTTNEMVIVPYWKVI